MKKIAAVLLALCLLLSFSACGGQAQDDGKLHIVTTVFAEYDWVKNILGDTGNAEITLLLDNGVDLHSYQPTAEDILNITESDLFVYVGGESDEWAEKLLEANKSVNALNLLDTLGENVLEEEIVEGMEGADEPEEEGGQAEYDEHIWLSLGNAKTICKALCNAVCKIDEANASVYESNTDKYIERLSALDAEYAEAVENAENKTLIFGDRFPFRYMTEDYGLSYYAAFMGCSAESEASFETISFLAQKLDELELTEIFVLDGSDRKLAETIVNATNEKNAEIIEINSMQSVTQGDVDAGADYISIMEKNLEALKRALS